jgi:hypothetical protein
MRNEEMSLIPTKSQWKGWTLPSKASYIGCVIGILALVGGVLPVLWSSRLSKIAGQPQLGVTCGAKPYLRYKIYDRGGMEFSYEMQITNSGRNPAAQLTYKKQKQTLVVDGKKIAEAEGDAERGAPLKLLVSGGHYFQIFRMANPNMTPQQVANCIAKYENEGLAIILELEIQYVDSITGRKYSIKETSKVQKGRVDILKQEGTNGNM